MMKQKMELIKENFQKATGMKACVVCNNKNGIDRWGLRQDGILPFAPIVYLENGETEKDYINRTEALFRNSDFYVDLRIFEDKEYILKNSFVGVQKKSKSNFVTRPVLNLEAYVFIVVDTSNQNYASTKMNQALLEKAGLSFEEVWEAAVHNTRKHLKYTSLEETLGIPTCGEPLFEVITAQNNMYGAAAIVIPEIFQEYCEKRAVEEIIILPSSVHEVLVLKKGSMPVSYQELAMMVDSVNNAEVDPEIQLEPVVYLYNATTNRLSIVADAR